ncbi:MAG: class I SAM-dependent methyltransferase [Ilumatobacteraceae bacterium]
MPDSSEYFETRLPPLAERERTWKHLTDYLHRYVPDQATVVDVGAGYCGFVNNVRADRKIAVDVHADVKDFADRDVEVLIGDAAGVLGDLPSGSVGLVFASNLVEHLDRDEIGALLSATRRVLEPGGRLMLLQPNYRRCAKEYFDDYTHVSVHSDRSLPDLLQAEGFEIVEVDPGLMPLTVKSRAAKLSFLVPWYLRLPWRPLAKQMLVVAQRP